jgi:nucleotide-binding universal stress UspA family protein
MIRRLLVAHDGSDGAQKAFDTALDLAQTLQAHVSVVCVEEDLPRYAENFEELRQAKEESESYFGGVTEQCRRRAALKGVDIEATIVAGHPVKVIGDLTAVDKVDLLVIGFTGHSRIYEHLWGGTSQGVVRAAHCSVLVVK